MKLKGCVSVVLTAGGVFSFIGASVAGANSEWVVAVVLVILGIAVIAAALKL